MHFHIRKYDFEIIIISNILFDDVSICLQLQESKRIRVTPPDAQGL